MSRGPDPATQFERALLASAARAGVALAIETSDWTRWASATFTGARHLLTLVAPSSPEFDAWLAALCETELAPRGMLVADVAVLATHRSADRTRVELEALTLEER